VVTRKRVPKVDMVDEGGRRKKGKGRGAVKGRVVWVRG
jgi:hypothetical protein